MPNQINNTKEDPRLVIRSLNEQTNDNKFTKFFLVNIFKPKPKKLSSNDFVMKDISTPNGATSTKRQASKLNKVFKIISLVFLVFLSTFLIAYLLISNSFKKIGLDITPIEAVNIASTQFSDATGINKGAQTNKTLPPQLLKDTSETVTNFLLVGIDTRPNSSEGLMNTDSIILISYNHRTQELTMLSIPRDTIVQSPDSDRFFKINSFYMLGEQKAQGYGLEHLSNVVNEYTGQKVNYYAMFNFNSFVQIIDILGGIEVNVDNTFTDYNYPDAPDNYLHFDAGMQTMDGTRALMYVRSRHSNDAGEGSDFARAKRQQKVVEALKLKIVNLNLLNNSQKILEILSSIGSNIKLSGYTTTDINAALYLLKNNQISKINSVVLDPNIKEGTLLTEDRWTELGYSITPVPSLGDYSQIHEFIYSTLFATNLSKLNPSISVYNCGSGYNKAFNLTQDLRNKMGIFDVQLKGDCPSDVPKLKNNNIIYHGTRDLSIAEAEIEKYLEIKFIKNSSDLWTYSDNSEIILLLGGE